MRLWKIQDLFDNIHKECPKAHKYVTLVHVCVKCGWRTHEKPPIRIEEYNARLNIPRKFEIKDQGYCDKCNQSGWQRVFEYVEYLQSLT